MMPIHTDAHARMLREPRSSSIVAAADSAEFRCPLDCRSQANTV